MTDSIAARQYGEVLEEIAEAAKIHAQTVPTLVTVSKTFSAEVIEPVIKAGGRIFGENRVQEAQGKWPELKSRYPDLKLHLIGPLQSNKATDAVALFDCIQTIDREKIARAVGNAVQKLNLRRELLVQVNTGLESQKAGIDPKQVEEFVRWCQSDVGLEISGLMCIPPNGENPGPHFALLRKLARSLSLGNLSMGMSSDYLTALEFGATHVRVGSRIFGNR